MWILAGMIKASSQLVSSKGLILFWINPEKRVEATKFQSDVADLVNHLELRFDKVYRSTLDFCTMALRAKCHLLFFSCSRWFQSYLLSGVSFPSTYSHRRHFRSMNQSSCNYLNPGPSNFTIHFFWSSSFPHNSGNLSGRCMDVRLYNRFTWDNISDTHGLVSPSAGEWIPRFPFGHTSLNILLTSP